MRFITEFELAEGNPRNEALSIKAKKESEEAMGCAMANAFGWENPVNGNWFRYKIAIEAFPMDKWIEFKQFLLGNFGYDPGIKQLLHNVIERLESHGKPITNDQSKTGSQLLATCICCLVFHASPIGYFFSII